MKSRIMFAMLTSPLLGCGSSATTVSGTVTVNNQPLQSGYVTFFAVESTKAARGAPVNDGKFSLKEIPPGKWKALISKAPEVQAGKSANGVPTLKLAYSAPAISPKTKGNQRIVEIRAGEQTLDFTLQQP